MMRAIPGFTPGEVLYESHRTTVLRARRTQDDRPVVLKLLNGEDVRARDLARVRYAFSLARELVGQGAVPHLELAAHKGRPVVVMEDSGAVSLDRILAEGRPALPRALALARAATEAIAALHAAHVLHLDVKPENIVVAPDDTEVRLIDFELASRLSRESAELARPERAAGTLAYLAPEQTGRTGRSLDARTDLYSLGVTLYQLFTGHLPFTEKDPLVLVHAHIARTPPDPCDLRADLPEALGRVLLRLLAKAPEDRYQSAHGVAADLERIAAAVTEGRDLDDFTPGQDDVSSTFQVPEQLVGRDEEIAALVGAFERASVGAAELALVTGYAGIGKSALVAALQAPVAQAGGRFGGGKSDQLQNVPYEAVIQALTEVIRDLLAKPPEVIETWSQRLQGAVGAVGRVLTDLVPELEHLVGAQPEVPELAPVEAQNRLGLAFAGLVEALAVPESPLVLFLDDLQWADAASLRAIRTLLERNIEHLLIIGAYRDQELTTDALPDTVAALRKGGATVTELHLGPLSTDAVTALVGATVGQPAEACADLGRLVASRTGGNPFFIARFLRGLYHDGDLRFDAEARRWTWDLDAIAARPTTENVAAFMTGQLQALPETSRDVVARAAVLGNEFGLAELADLVGTSTEETAAALWPAVREEMVTGVGTDWHLAAVEGGGAGVDAGARYRFAHDRVQEAAAGLLDEEVRQRVHLAIGRRMLAEGGDVVDAVIHLDHADALITEPAERVALARHNLAAGHRARSAAAFAQARSFFERGIALLGDDPWAVDPTLARRLHKGAAEGAWLTDDTAAMEAWISAATPHVDDPLERAELIRVRMRSLMGRGMPTEGLAVAMEALSSLGLDFPESPGMHHVLLSLGKTKLMLRGRTDEDLLALPECTDRQLIGAQSILGEVLAAAYLTKPTLYPLLILALVRQALTAGIAPISPMAFANYALLLTLVLKDFEGGHRFNALAKRMGEREHCREYRPRAHFVDLDWIAHTYMPLREILVPLEEQYRDALELGDLEYGAFYAVVLGYTEFLVGTPLPEAEARMRRMASTIQGQHTQYVLLTWTWQLMQCLMGQAPDPLRIGGEVVEDAEAWLASTSDEANQATFPMMEVLLDLYLRGGAHGLASVARVREHIEGFAGLPYVPILDWVDALLRIRDQPGHGSTKKAVKKARKTLATYTALCPENYEHRGTLLEAEVARVEGRSLEAARLYEEAIDQARDRLFLHEEALAHELAGRFHLSEGRDRLGRSTMREARSVYERYGMKAKLDRLDKEYPWLVAEGTTTSLDAPSQGLDLISMLRASQALSRELKLDDLMGSLMDVVAQNAGAENAVLFLEEDGRLLRRAHLAGVSGVLDLDPGSPLRDGAGYPASLVRYVARTRQQLTLDDALRSRFQDDPHVVGNGVRSAMAVPILNRQRLVGVLYLENNLTARAFHTRRVEVVSLLSGQIAISLENARLVDRLEASLERQRALTRAQQRFVPDQFLQSLGRADIHEVQLGDAVQKEMSVLFSDIRGFTSRSERMAPEENIAFINRYLDHMERPIFTHGGFVDSYIGDAIMALFDTSADRAVVAALEMLRAQEELNAELQRNGQEPVRTGIGLNTGPLMLGTMGGPNRMKCSVIGDSVNLAARVESLTKEYGSSLLVTDHTVRRLVDPELYAMREVDCVGVVGREEPVTLFDVYAEDDAACQEQKAATADTLAEALAAWRSGDLDRAAEAFADCADRAPADRVPALYLARCERLRAEGLPADWDGVTRFTTK